MDKRKLKFSKMMFSGAFIYNPVLTQAIGICTIVAIGTTLKISLIFSLMISALLIIMELLSSLVFKRFSRWMRVSTYMLVSTLLLLPVVLYMDKNYSELSAAMGIFLPLLAVNSIIVIRCEVFAVNNSLRNSLFDAIASSVGFSVVSIIVGALREIIAYGTIMGKTVPHLTTLSAVALPFGGILTVGFLSALHKWILIKKFPRYPSSTFNLRTAFDTPSFKNEGINATDGSLSLMRDPTPLEEAQEDEIDASEGFNLSEKTVDIDIFADDTDEESEDSLSELKSGEASESTRKKEDKE